MEIALWMALAFGFYMAWTIGANDAANAMGTSVGSKSIGLKEAIIIAVIFEFAGAVLAGADVAETMRSGIVDPALFADLAMFPAGNGMEFFVWGMLSALISAALWVHIATFLGWPVSTSHSIVGAIAGFGIVSVGIANINWGSLLFISGSWVTSPLIGGVLAFSVFSVIRKFIIESNDPNRGVRVLTPILSFPVFGVLMWMLFTKGLKNVDLSAYGITDTVIGGSSLVVAAIGAFALAAYVKRIHIDPDAPLAERNASIEKVFRYLQVITACFVAFAHGSNDVANSIGPIAAIVGTIEAGTIAAQVAIPSWVLLLGAVGIVIGLATYGYRVIETIGTKITEITPSRGFAAEIGAASTILVGSSLGLPLSTTHTIVGAVIGVGFARGINALNLKVVWSIVKSWLYTLPFTAVLAIVLFKLLTAIFI